MSLRVTLHSKCRSLLRNDFLSAKTVKFDLQRTSCEMPLSIIRSGAETHGGLHVFSEIASCVRSSQQEQIKSENDEVSKQNKCTAVLSNDKGEQRNSNEKVVSDKIDYTLLGAKPKVKLPEKNNLSLTKKSLKSSKSLGEKKSCGDNTNLKYSQNVLPCVEDNFGMAHQDINKFNRLIKINAETCQSDVKKACQVVRKVESGQNEVVKDCGKEVIVKGDISSQNVKINGHKVNIYSQDDKTYGQKIKTIKGKIDLDDCNDKDESKGRNVMPENQAENGGNLPELTSPKKVKLNHDETSLKKMVFFADPPPKNRQN